MTSLRWLPALALCACGIQRPSPDLLYRRAEASQRRGELDAALEGARLGLKLYAWRPQWKWPFRLLTAEILLDRGETPAARQLLEGIGEPDEPELRARWLLDFGNVAYWLSDRGRARSSFEQAWQLGQKISARPGLLAEIELSRAVVSHSFEETEACYRRAAEFASRAGDSYLLARAYAGLGYNRLKYERYDQALPWLETAQKAAEEHSARRLLSNTLGNRGRCYAALGDFDQALHLLTRASAIAGQINDKRNQQIWLGNLGDVYQRLGDYTQAVACLNRSRALAEERHDKVWLGTVLRRTADLCLRAGKIAEASAFTQRALSVQTDLLGARREAENERRLVESELLAARIASANGLFSDAQSALQKVILEAGRLDEVPVIWEAHAELASLYRRTRRYAEAESEYRQAIGAIEETRSLLLRDTSKVTFLAKLIHFYQDYVDFLADQNRSADALRVAESARARVLMENLNLRRSGASLSIPDLQRRLKGTNTAVLAFWLASRRSFLWVITSRSFAQFTLPDESAIRALVEKYQAAILNRGDPAGRGSGLANQLYQTLLQPARAVIRASPRVVVIPDASLYNLNFETLLVPGDEPHYWIEDVMLSVVPSLEVLAAAKPAPRRSGDRNLLFIGDPLPAEQYPPLPHLKQELEILQRVFAPRQRAIYSGPQALPNAYREAHPDRFAAIHFAAHATSNKESPLNSAVILSPKGEEYKLYAKDVLGVPIHAEVVTISACRSAGPRAYSGEGLMGFGWAFLQAGAQHVVAGLWDVDDAATARLMAGFYESLRQGMDPATALRAAKLELLHYSTLYRKPFFWAPFQVFARQLPAPAGQAQFADTARSRMSLRSLHSVSRH